jgi:uncharacterized metal-binding protein YceD (DUF177 family)
MLVNLAEIESKKPIHREFVADVIEVQTVTEQVKVEKVRGKFRIQVDPLGYLVKFQLSGQAHLTCIRSGEPFIHPIQLEDWISLRTQAPDDHNVILGDSELNVRFIEDLKFEVDRFVAEVLELELPAYPRRDSDDEEEETAETEASEPSSTSPFSVLSKFLD